MAKKEQFLKPQEIGSFQIERCCHRPMHRQTAIRIVALTENSQFLTRLFLAAIAQQSTSEVACFQLPKGQYIPAR